MTSLDRAFTERFKAAVLQAAGPRVVSIRVFGSRARGDFRPDSDLDILILVDHFDQELRSQLSGLAYDLSMEMGLFYGVSVHVQSTEHFERIRRAEALFAREVDEQSIAI